MPNAQTTQPERQYFKPSRFNEGLETLKEIQKASIPVITNFDDVAAIPKEHGLLLQPVLERNKAKKGGPLVLTSYIAAHVPDLSVVSTTDQGTEYLYDALMESFARRLKQDVAQAEASHMKPKLPTTVEEFTSKEQRDNLFQNLMQETVRKLKAQGGSLNLITQAILRNVLQSATFAKGMFPGIPQEDWEGVINSMITQAKETNVDTSILDDWKAKRADVEVKAPERIKL